MSDWQKVDATVPEDVVVETCISDIGGERNRQTLRRRASLWFFPDNSMYVYYTPTHWRPVDGEGVKP